MFLIAVNNYSDGRNYLRTQFDRNFSFFYVELPDGTILSHLVEENEIFPAQFGREVSFINANDNFTLFLFCILIIRKVMTHYLLG